MTLVDLLHYLLEDIAPTAALLSVAVGAGFLWRRTRRTSSLAQFIAASLLFAGVGLYQLRWRLVTPYDQSAIADIMRSEAIRISMSLAQFIGLLAFAVSYVCYALRPNASNQAMQRTAGRSAF